MVRSVTTFADFALLDGLFRIATRDCEIRGVEIPKGSAIWVMFGSANRDERMFPDQDLQNELDAENLYRLLEEEFER